MATFGPTLRRTREERSISLDEIANETRLSKRYILALEDEAIGKLPGGTYNRAYLRTYATYLGLDPEALLRDYASEEARHLQATEADQLAAMNRAIERRGALVGSDGRASGREGLLKAAALATVAVVLLAAAGGAVWLVGRTGVLGSSAAIEVESGAPAEASTPVAASVPSAAPVSEPAPPPAPSTETSAAGSAGAARETVAESTTPPSGSAPSAAMPVASPAQADASTATGDSALAAAPSAAPAAPAVPGGDNGAARVVTVSSDAGTADTVSRLTVADSGVGTAVIDRQLVGQSDRFTVGSKVVFWTHVRGGRAGDTIDHVWMRDGIIVGAASLTVGSPDWRTQSRRLLDPSGVWVVEARDADGHVLARHQFRADQTSAQ